MIMLVKAIELTLFPAVMAFAASSDLLTMTIANRVSIILVAGFGALAVLTGMSAAGLMSHVGAAAVVLSVVFVFFACGWIGGDAKLAAATALWLGDLDVVEAHDGIDLDRMGFGELPHDLPMDLTLGWDVDDEIAANPRLAA